MRGDKNSKTLVGNVLRKPPLFCRELKLHILGLGSLGL